MIQFSPKQWRVFRHLQKKHQVSMEFLRYNLNNIQKIIWYETWPRIIIKRYAIRKRNRVFVVYHRLRRVLFDHSHRKLFFRLRQNIRQWSKKMVAYRRTTVGTEEYVEEIICEKKSEVAVASEQAQEDVSQQLKKQLELLKSARRQQPLIDSQTAIAKTNSEKQQLAEGNPSCPAAASDDVADTAIAIHLPQKSDRNLENIRNIIQDSLRSTKPKEPAVPLALDNHQTDNDSSAEKTPQYWQDKLESTPEKQITSQENVQPFKQLATDEKTEKSQHEDELAVTGQKSTDKAVKTGLNFLDMLMCKVTAKQVDCNTAQAVDNTTKSSASKTANEVVYHHEHSLDSADEFLGFEDAERVPGMLMTPIVPFSIRGNKNSAFVSESLNEYMRANDLETDYNIDDDKAITHLKILHTDLEGLVTKKTQPPAFDMPAVPDNLLKFRTVAERKNYLQKCSKNHRLSIINNEASIYRELQKRIRYQKTKHTSQLVAQSSNSSMPFTRNGWHVASFINTEFNKYHYQMLDVDRGLHQVRLKGVRGNNDKFRKKAYISFSKKSTHNTCPPMCVDQDMWQDFKPIQTFSPKTKKLNKEPLASVFKPCPLSHKALQKPLDDDAAALLLAGGSMAVVRMPTVELEVFPANGRPLNEIAKRYLQYILPHHDISREWAEFSVSTLKLPGSLKDAVQAATDSMPRKSFTFLIPYLNDRNHVLVRRVVDRSEKLDQSFENCLETELVPKTDFTFRQNIDQSDEVLITCADVVSDMINTVAISCSENSFIKIDPDMLSEADSILLSPTHKLGRPPSSASNSGPATKKPTKQKRVLLELKRLNATIIDAAVKPEEDKTPCSKEYCAMGCICNSLTEDTRLREHCGKAKCILDCSCKGSNPSRIMRLETDGRTITTEDAFMLRRKATARLARMEKEFTSTVVLTENETLLINETNNDKKRRCTKVPKRYECDDDSDEEPRKTSPKKTALTTIDNEKNLAVEVKEIREPVYIEDTILDQMKHCTVNLTRLQDMDNVATWCMVHQLYKCFCKGRSVEGKPMIIEKDENNTTIEHGEDEQQQHQQHEMDYKATTKARYTFEKVENKKRKSRDEESNSVDDDEEDYAANYGNPSMVIETPDEEEVDKADENYEPTERQPKKVAPQLATEEQEDNLLETRRDDKERPKRNLEDVRTRFFATRLESCRRHIPIPRRMFLYCNRKRRLNVLKYIKNNETEKTRLLLNEHIMRSVYYHKIDSEKLKDTKESKESEKTLQKPLEKAEEDTNQKNQTKAKSCINNAKDSSVTNEVVNLLDDEEDVMNLAANKTSTLTKPSHTVAMEAANVSDLKPQSVALDAGVITMKAFASLSGVHVNNNNTNNSSSSSSASANVAAKCEELKLPKISNCFSLNAKANLRKTFTSPAEKASAQQQHMADFTSATSVYSPAFNSSRSRHAQQTAQQSETAAGSTASGVLPVPAVFENDNIRDVYNNVIRTMNTLVSKKMQDVDFALKRDSHIIPTPNADILCMMKWSNFLEAYCQGYAFIWQVKTREGTYLVATIRNMLPMVPEAMGVVNITALKPERVPLMGKMLLQNVRNEHTAKLAIVMQGKMSYWIIKGFLRADPATACNKPTPETHPSLTKKINVLCTSLVKQRQKEEKNKEAAVAAQRWSTAVATVTNKVAKVAQIMPTPRNAAVQETVPQMPVQTATPVNSMQPPTPQSSSQQLQPSPTTTFVSPASPVPSSVPNANAGPKAQPVQNSRKRKSTGDTTANGKILPKIDGYAKMSTNIEFRKVTREDIDEIHLPEVHKNNHKWLVLDLHNDFSHIFVPDFRDLVSLDRIQKVINFAMQKNKIVKLQFFQNAPFDAFVTPKSGRKIYFGPLDMNMKPPTLILLQSVDGQMMIRELYQLKHAIQKPLEERTKAFWLLQMNGQTHFEVDVVTTKDMEHTVPPVIAIQTAGSLPAKATEDGVVQSVMPLVPNNQIEPQHHDDDDDDEDCMIIDETHDNATALNSTPTKERYNFTIGSQANNNNAIAIVPQTNSLPGPLPIQTLITTTTPTAQSTEVNASFATPATSTSSSVLNTVITPLLKMPLTQATNAPVLSSLPPHNLVTGLSNATTPTFTNNANTMLNLPPNAVITSITSAPQEAAYGSTIFISSANTPDLSKSNKPLAQVPPEVITVNDELPPNQPVAQKRRRISLVCHNRYDLNSQNIAVNAVINKILPENVQDIQVNQTNAGSIAASAATTEGLKQNALQNEGTTSTIGSTTITKIPESLTSESSSSSYFNTKNSNSNKRQTDAVVSQQPVVFDVSFVDGMDEPAASILIKPTTPTKSIESKVKQMVVSTSSSTVIASAVTVISSAASTPVSHTATSTPRPPQTQSTAGITTTASVLNSITATHLQKFNIKNANNKHIGYKVVRVPTSLASVLSGNATTASARQPQILSRLLGSTSTVTTSTSSSTSAIVSSLPQLPTNVVAKTVATSQLQSNVITKTVLNTTNPIKITPITPSPTTKAIIKPLEPVATSITITSVTKPMMHTKQTAVAAMAAANPHPGVVKTSVTAAFPSRSVTIRQILPKPAPTEMQTKTVPTKPPNVIATTVMMASANATATATTTTSTSTTVLPTVSSNATSSSVTAGTAATASTRNTLSPPLAITNVQTLGNTRDKPAASVGLPSHIQYGYIVSPVYTDLKFVAKRVMDEFYVKVPSVGIMKLMGMTAVDNYLNKRKMKTSDKNSAVVPGNWYFTAASKAIQMQNHQKSLLVRKTKPGSDNKLPTRLNSSSKSDSNKSHKVVTVTSMSEPILIDD